MKDEKMFNLANTKTVEAKHILMEYAEQDIPYATELLLGYFPDDQDVLFTMEQLFHNKQIVNEQNLLLAYRYIVLYMPEWNMIKFLKTRDYRRNILSWKIIFKDIKGREKLSLEAAEEIIRSCEIQKGFKINVLRRLGENPSKKTLQILVNYRRRSIDFDSCCKVASSTIEAIATNANKKSNIHYLIECFDTQFESEIVLTSKLLNNIPDQYVTEALLQKLYCGNEDIVKGCAFTLGTRQDPLINEEMEKILLTCDSGHFFNLAQAIMIKRKNISGQ
jgi:hypothetical protein